MLYKVVFEFNSAEKKDCFQQKVKKINAPNDKDAKNWGRYQASLLGKGWKFLYARSTQSATPF